MSKAIYKHPLFTTFTDINDICKPLKEYFGIDFFMFLRDTFDKDLKTQIALAPLNNNPELSEFLLNYEQKEPMSLSKDQSSNYYFHSPVWAKQFKLNNFLWKAEKINDRQWNRVAFATTSDDPNKLNFYLNNRDLLDNFIVYFREKAEKQIKLANQNEIKSCQPVIHQNQTSNIVRDNFLKAIQPKRHLLRNSSGEKVFVPHSELLCLKYMAQGRTSKETAKILNLSPRTVETNWKRSKTRLSCFSRHQLLDILHSHQYF